LRVEPELHRKLREASARRDLSLNEFCARRLREAVGESRSLTEEVRYGVPVSPLRRRLEEAGLPVLGCVVFGSVARGEADAASDLDLLLVLPSRFPLTRGLYEVWDREMAPVLKSSVPREVSPQFVTLPDSALDAGGLWYEVALDGIPLWDEGLKISALLRGLREAMARGELRRRMSHGHPFWLKRSSIPNEE
jgi:predicted nucleotidyltransferase